MVFDVTPVSDTNNGDYMRAHGVRSFLLWASTSMSEAFLSSRSSVYLPPRPLKAAASEDIKSDVLAEMQSTRDEAQEYAESFELSQAEASLFALFSAIKTLPVGLGFKGTPFVLRREEIDKAMDQESGLSGFFKTIDLEKALKDDFLDAARGSVDNRSGWKIFDVSQPRGESFEEARMSHEDVTKALEKGTVIFNAAGAHIPKLAGPSLACTDATALPCALNLYVTDMGKRTSAPPHTDKQVSNYIEYLSRLRDGNIRMSWLSKQKEANTGKSGK